MLIRTQRVPTPIALLLLLCAYLGWKLGTGPHIGVGTDPPGTEGDSVIPGPPQPRIAVVTFITDQKSYIHLSLKNKDHYARRHRYAFHVDYESHASRGTLWSKFDMIERLIRSGQYDWIWFLDFDTLITNTNIRVMDVINEAMSPLNPTQAKDVDYLLTHDCNGLNAGSFIVRGHDRSIRFFDNVRSEYDKEKDKGSFSEQDAMVRLLNNDEETRKHALRVPQIKLNAFPEEIKCYEEGSPKWEDGTFVIHFAGAWAHVQGDDPTGQLMSKYENKIQWGDWKGFY